MSSKKNDLGSLSIEDSDDLRSVSRIQDSSKESLLELLQFIERQKPVSDKLGSLASDCIPLLKKYIEDERINDENCD